LNAKSEQRNLLNVAVWNDGEQQHRTLRNCNITGTTGNRRNCCDVC